MKSDEKRYGFVPFWFWNGDQDADEVKRQVRLAAKSGLKGLAIHAREGNRTEYLSDKWFSLVKTACDEAKKHFLKIWIYDEEGYPSGTAGHKIQKLSPEYRQQYLSFGYFSSEQIKGLRDIVAVFDSETYTRADERQIISSKKKSKGKFLVFQRKFYEWYVDTMNPEVTSHFIRLTHEKYKKKLGKYFGKTITHFYTDDVNFHMEGCKGLPWTGNLDFKFRYSHGYSILENLPALVESMPDSEQVRKDYYRTLLELFIANFADPVYKWCHRNGVKFTGHLRGDEGSIERSIIQFSSPMPFFEYEDVPGIDDFLLRLHDFRYLDKMQNSMGLYPIPTYKFASSVANQLKSGTCGAEVMASCGWGYSLAEQNAQLNFEANMGINLFTPHDFSYATAGVAKRDHPPSFFFQQPYWPLWRELHAKFARISRLLSRGVHHADVLVFYPESHSWSQMDGESIDPSFKCRNKKSVSMKNLAAIERSIAEICFSLVKSHVGFDIGSELILEKHGYVKSGRMHVGKMSYGTVIVPQNTFILPEVKKILAKFADAGGKIIYSNAIVESDMEKDIDLNGDVDEIAVHTRIYKGEKWFFFSNFTPDYRSFKIPEPYSKYEVYDPESSRVIAYGRGWDRKISLPPFGCAFLLPSGGSKADKIKIEKSIFHDIRGRNSAGLDDFAVTREDGNVMLVESCYADGKLVPLSEVHLMKPLPREFKFKFKVPKGAFVSRLLGENLENCRMTVNGKKVPVDQSYEFPVTRCLQSARIRNFTCKGDNEIVIKPRKIGKRIENFYITGHFTVDIFKNGKIGTTAKFAASEKFSLGNLAAQGLPFYWGSVKYDMKLKDIRKKGFTWLDLGKVDGAVEVFVDRKKIASKLHPPYRIYIGNLEFKMNSNLEIRLYNTAQNFFGPHRWENLDTAIVHIVHESHGKSRNFNVKPFGIHGPVKLIK
ncbi:MAG TPA: hypothetical protein DET40_22100 [Lentisphaeria bacterium]|nr:MAG: hypothetical protein A2X45_04190 [Lentisphaerae bacterium GWF2_50_93]HCE46247.1 hypothetical protein [Lentisphaeria bacterium]